MPRASSIGIDRAGSTRGHAAGTVQAMHPASAERTSATTLPCSNVFSSTAPRSRAAAARCSQATGCRAGAPQPLGTPLRPGAAEAHALRLPAMPTAGRCWSSHRERDRSQAGSETRRHGLRRTVGCKNYTISNHVPTRPMINHFRWAGRPNGCNLDVSKEDTRINLKNGALGSGSW